MTEETDQPPEPWRPLHFRESEAASVAYDEPMDGTPSHLEPSLRGWVIKYLGGSSHRLLEFERILRTAFPPLDNPTATLVSKWENSTPEFKLAIVDTALHLLHERFNSKNTDQWVKNDALDQIITLMRYLDQGGSLWRVAVLSDDMRLMRRVSDAARDQLAEVVRSGADAGRELSKAWHECYRREPNPKLVYDHAVAAVEAAAGPVLTPKDSKPSLGKVIKHLEQTPGRYSVGGLDSAVVASHDVLLALLRLVWVNHPRHAQQGGKSPEQVAHETAEAALAASITLVQWFVSGLVRGR